MEIEYQKKVTLRENLKYLDIYLPKNFKDDEYYQESTEGDINYFDNVIKIDLDTRKIMKNNDDWKGSGVIKVCWKVRDTFTAALLSDTGRRVVYQEEDYVWDIMPGHFCGESGRHYGDYIILEVDTSTNEILNWNLSQARLEDFVQAFLNQEEDY